VTEMMYFPFAPRSIAEVGTIVELSEKIAISATKNVRTFAFDILNIRPLGVVLYSQLQW
jgi:hypothetical protein